jgi:hypothetical protein
MVCATLIDELACEIMALQLWEWPTTVQGVVSVARDSCVVREAGVDWTVELLS